ncbi:MAG TPA: hypothetical protein VGH28_26840 [Polyangiaceae bacterium]|jgi:hypothetical protein
MFLVADLSALSPSTQGTVVSRIVSPNASDSPAVLANLSEYEDVFIDADLFGATGGTLDVFLQSWDGVDWVDWLHFATVTAGHAGASFVYVPQKPTATSIVTVGRNASPLLAAGVGVGSHPGQALRVLFVAGSGTTAGAQQTIRVMARNRWTR